MVKNKKIKSTEKPKTRKKGFLSTFFLLIFLSSLTASSYLIYKEVEKEINIQNMENNIQSFIKSSDKTPLDDNKSSEITSDNVSDNNSYSFDWEGLMNQSEYIVGWIQIPGIERINYPIVQTDDNQFFLTRDWTGAYQSAGAIFMNKYNASDFSDMNTVIYGHQMITGSMFGLLKHYEAQNFMDENPYICIYTPDGHKMTYEIICCCHVTDGSDAYMLHFESPDERMAYYNMMIYNAVTKREVDLNRLDTTIMLSTCNNTGYYDRTTILGKLISIDLNEQPENLE